MGMAAPAATATAMMAGSGAGNFATLHCIGSPESCMLFSRRRGGVGGGRGIMRAIELQRSSSSWCGVCAANSCGSAARGGSGSEIYSVSCSVRATSFASFFPAVRVVCKGLGGRRNVLLGRGLKCTGLGVGGGRVRRSSAKRTYAAATSVESSVSLKALENDGDGEAFPSLSSKPILTMQSPVRVGIEKDLQTPPLKPAPKPALRLRPREPGQQGASTGAQNGSNAPRSEPAAALNLNQILENVEKLGAGDSQSSGARTGSNSSERPRPGPSTQPRAWKAGDKLRSKAERDAAREKAAQLESRSNVAGSDAEASTSAANSVIPNPRPKSQLTTLAKPVMDPPPSTGEAGAARPRAPLAPGRLVKKGPVLRDVGAGPRAPAPRSVATSPAAAAAPGAPKAFTKAAVPKGKEDWRKKSNMGSDGAKRRVSAREQDSMDVVADLTGAQPARRGNRKMNKASRKAIRVEAARAAAPVKVEILEVGPEGMSCQELAEKLAINDSEIVKVLFMKGIGITVNQTLDEETVQLVCKEFEVEVVEAGALKVENMAKKLSHFGDEDELDQLVPRPPVVTIMGHVDHGKTSLLDRIRKTQVAAGEAGGITQGIGAYSVRVKVQDEEQTCVFLDTPGHQAFSAMRARGARVTDIAVIVVAADDGVRPQTLEAIAHAKAANVPIVIAINKIDKEGANPANVMEELSTHGLMPEDWGGEVPMVQVSARSGEKIEDLLENIMLVAEFQELKANPHRSAQGTVIEARLDKARGPLATLLVQNGTLQKGDVVLCGSAYGKVRVLMDYTGAGVEEAGPSTAVQILGLNTVPVAGDEFEIMDSIESARCRAAECAQNLRSSRLVAQAGEGKVTLHSFANAVAASRDTGVERHQLNVVLKVDAQGSVEAIREVLQTLPQDTVALRFLMQSTGEISASDVDLAVASGAVVVGFNVGLQPGVQTQADNEGVEVRLYQVIYELVDDIRKAMEGLLGNVEEEVPIGQAEVRAVFGAGSGRVAGCMVTEGKLVKGTGVRVVRGSSTVHVGTVGSLRRVKEAAKEVAAGLECGVGVDGFNEWEEGDSILVFKMVAKKRTLEDASVTVRAAVDSITNKQAA